MRGPETRLYRYVKKLLEAEFPGCWVRKINISRFQNRGIPDLICCIQGKFFGLETKIPGRDPTLNQLTELRAIVRAGGVAAVVRGKRNIVKFIRSKL